MIRDRIGGATGIGGGGYDLTMMYTLIAAGLYLLILNLVLLKPFRHLNDFLRTEVFY